MKTPQFAPQEYVSAAIFNNAAASGVANDVALGKALASPGIVAPSFAALTTSGTVLTANLPAPFGIFFGTGRLVHAHGALSNADTQTYSVPFSGIIPASGTTTGYLIAASGQIQQNPYQVIGPPPGHPDYNPDFVPYTAYATLTDTLLLSASLTPADNLSTFELARFTLNAGASGLTPNTAFQNLSGTLNLFSVAAVSGNVQVEPDNAGTLYNALNNMTFTLPPISGIGGIYGFTTQQASGATIQVSGATAIYGTVGAPTSGVTTFNIGAGDCVFLQPVNSNWVLVAGSQNSSSDAAIQLQAGNFAVDTGAVANDYVITLNPQPTSMAEIKGVPIRFQVGAGRTNTAGLVKLEITPNIPLTTILGADGDFIANGALKAGMIYTVFSDGTNFRLNSTLALFSPAPNGNGGFFATYDYHLMDVISDQSGNPANAQTSPMVFLESTNSNNQTVLELLQQSGVLSTPALAINYAAGGSPFTETMVEFLYNNVPVGSITSNNTGTAFVTTSDERLKFGFESIDPNFAEKFLEAVGICSFFFKHKDESVSSVRHYGAKAKEACENLKAIGVDAIALGMIVPGTPDGYQAEVSVPCIDAATKKPVLDAKGRAVMGKEIQDITEGHRMFRYWRFDYGRLTPILAIMSLAVSKRVKELEIDMAEIKAMIVELKGKPVQ